jgi:hypothetical protein
VQDLTGQASCACTIPYGTMRVASIVVTSSASLAAPGRHAG